MKIAHRAKNIVLVLAISAGTFSRANAQGNQNWMRGLSVSEIARGVSEVRILPGINSKAIRDDVTGNLAYLFSGPNGVKCKLVAKDDYSILIIDEVACEHVTDFELTRFRTPGNKSAFYTQVVFQLTGNNFTRLACYGSEISGDDLYETLFGKIEL